MAEAAAFNSEKFITNFQLWAKQSNIKLDYDAPQLAAILVAFGFKLKYADISQTSYKLPNNGDGVRVVITCSHTGQRFGLESRREKAQCKCVQVPLEENSDIVYDVAIEENKTCVLMQKVENNQAELMKAGVSFLMSVVKGDFSEDVPKIIEPPTESLTVPKITSPVRSQSLDTLLAKQIIESHPDYGSLKKFDGSENSLILPDDVSNSAIHLIKGAITNLQKTVTLIENGKSSSTNSLIDATIKSASKTIKKMIGTKPKSTSTTSVNSLKSASTSNLIKPKTPNGLRSSFKTTTAKPKTDDAQPSLKPTKTTSIASTVKRSNSLKTTSSVAKKK